MLASHVFVCFMIGWVLTNGFNWINYTQPSSDPTPFLGQSVSGSEILGEEKSTKLNRCHLFDHPQLTWNLTRGPSKRTMVFPLGSM